MNYTKQADEDGHNFERIMLAARGGEKQRTNVVQLAFMFDCMVQRRLALEPGIDKYKSHLQLLEEQVQKYHKHPGVTDMKKWQLDAFEIRSMQN